jgi:hypothetical protein
MNRIVALAATAALSFPLGGCHSGNAGSRCNASAETPCDDGLVCAADAEGNDTCQVPAGGACDPGANDSHCVAGTTCYPDGDAGRCGIAAGGACDPTIASDQQCAPGLVCAEVTGGTDPYACFEAVLVEGRVFDATSGTGIEGARVIALDDLAVAVTDVAVSAADGTYTLDLPVARDAMGVPLDATFTLRASAADYQTFPGGIRTALPIDSTDAVEMDAGWILATPPTDIALVPLEPGAQGNPSVSGTVDSSVQSAGVLVVAEPAAGGGGFSDVTDAAGAFTIFNVPDGDYEVRGYAAGVQLTPAPVTVAGADVTGVTLTDSAAALSSISGSLQIVDPGMGTATSVVLVVASTFDDTFVRGDVPPGLRAPVSGPPTITGAWTIDGVPDGSYVVLAAFENDDLVRDPDPNIAGTQIVTVTAPDPAGTTITLTTSFKVTGALTLLGPGVDAAEAVTDPPTFSWVDDASEDFYDVVVYDSYGNLVWEEPMSPSVTGGDVSVVYGGPALMPGLYYQFRATSWRAPGGGMSGPISTTEDLRGVFFVQ